MQDRALNDKLDSAGLKSNETPMPKILIVEDYKFNQNLLLRHLHHVGFHQIDTADDGKEAWHKIKQNNYDIILSDIRMPHMDGMALLKKIKETPKYSDIPFVIISAIDEIEMVAEAIEIGAEDFLQKPYNSKILSARINHCLERKRLKDAKERYLQMIEHEKQESEKLLKVILPEQLADELKQTGNVQPKLYDNVGILFCDIVGFTQYCNDNPHFKVIEELKILFEAFEGVVEKHGIEKIKTIGDCFMAASGLHNHDDAPITTVIMVGLDMIEACRRTIPTWQVRVGVHAGSVIAGVVGTLKYQYDIWGDTVNVAVHLTQLAEPNRIACHGEHIHYINGRFAFTNKGLCNIKGKDKFEVLECYISGVR